MTGLKMSSIRKLIYKINKLAGFKIIESGKEFIRLKIREEMLIL